MEQATSRLLYDVTKASRQKHTSGLTRVSACLARELSRALGDRFVAVVWDDSAKTFSPLGRGRGFRIRSSDALLTAELFCEYEREGVESFLSSSDCQTFAIFHDAIPLQHPEFTWPHSVQRHPSYMKMLAQFSGVFAVSSHSSILLEEYWQWLGFEYPPSVKALQLGADGVFPESSLPKTERNERLQILMLGILEKRKGQDLALEACMRLWDEGLAFELHFVGRANPYFGKEIERRIKRASKQGLPITVHGQLSDDRLQSLFELADLTIVPSRAEGCGLPVLESLWKGVPTVCSRLNSIRESSRFGGCLLFDPGDLDAFANALRILISKRDRLNALTASIKTDLLPRWGTTVKQILDHLASQGVALQRNTRPSGRIFG